MTISNQPRILLVDDDKGMREFIGRALLKYIPESQIVPLPSGKGLIEMVSLYKPQLVILDWVLGCGQTGPGLCRQLKLNPVTKQASVLIITGKRIENKDELKSIAYGADAYLEKPFTTKQIADCAKALIRKNSLFRAGASGVFKAGNLLLNKKECQIYGPHIGVRHLPTKLFGVLWLLTRHYPRFVVSRHLIRYVWRNTVRDNEAAVAVSRLKRYLDTRDCLIEYVAGQGYRLVIPS